MSLNLNYKPDSLVDTENLSREEWLRYRRKGIGGSDAAAVMGLSPFCTKRDLYYDKIGIQAVMDEEEDNWVAKEVGHRLEDLVAEIYAKKTGLKVFPIRKMFFHPLFPFMLADVDFFIGYPDGSMGILECKTTGYHGREKWEHDSVPVNYEYQGRHYMAVMNLNRVVFACLYGNNENDFIIREMERDLEIEENLIQEEEYFWKENVQNKTEPPYTEKPDLVLESIRKHYGPADADAAAVKLGRSHIMELENYLRLKEEKAKLEKQVKRLDEQMKEACFGIVEEMGVSCKGIIRDGSREYVITYNPVYRTGIDKNGLKKLETQHPDIYEDYVKVSESRRFSVMKKDAA
ncbi:MAG TPA: YqaJ viral recombinase family protein [Candidatus Eisenbergiella merdavium]|uniref:YqaJ viral recombinase family protein n=1 Tax=Candidatus Eisenbergiella merdavium TaxID=2838551 RepID=A0A9D2SQI9_9FIRM|nr:YqaJ viral recombinase family protein [Candidatus Eisenbergiella merdavium]